MTKYALVTGGSRGIGRAVCKELAAAGYAVLINCVKNAEAAAQVEAEITAAGGQAEVMPFDVADAQAVDTALEGWEARHPDDAIEVLVNNAGIRSDAVMIFMADAAWHDVINTSVDGFFYVTRRVLKGMLMRRRGRIINMVSLSGLKGMPGQTNYSAAKAAVIGATRALAQEVARRRVTVNAVAPGFITTDMTKDLDQAALQQTIPAGRFGQPEEVAALVGFLASERAGYITGQVISINGGLM